MPATVIVRLPNWLGDTVMAVPAIRALRAGLPGAAMLLAGPWASLLTGQDLADSLVTYPRAWSGRLATADAVRAFRGDTAVLLPNSLEAAVAAWYWGARRRVGFATGGRSMLLTERVPLPSPRPHQVDEYLLLVEPLGVPVTTRVPRLEPPPEEGPERVAARALLREARVPARRSGRPVLGVHLGAAFGPAKVWPSERVEKFCRTATATGAVPVLLGTPGEEAQAREIVAASAVPSIVGRDSPALLPAVLAELDGLVAGDTGVAHLAAALGTPVLTLFGPTDPARSAPRGPVTVLRHPVPCAPCFYRTCPIDHPCLTGIEPRAVVEAARALVGAGR
jgi:heptosyltransferase-2